MSAALQQPEIPRSPWLAAKQGYGADATAYVERYRLDGTRCGMVQGRHAAWNWAYRVGEFNLGRVHLSTARALAACMAATVVEKWSGGSTYIRGPKGGLRRVTPVAEPASAVIQHAPIAHVRYTREPHGVHLAGSHEPRDVEHWSVAHAPGAPHHPAVPRDATYVSSLPVDGVSYALYVRWAPASACPSCPTCAARAARRAP
jgi:hypothetical protein